ncbi:TMEM175 family protein [Actinocrispum sp. NPDC049592]|uniref:TMEM175 family protein n=1 Tax=Actinocrispum sp. NPDC049592 TaxID=3154835 RepID=UPI003429B6A3
MATISRDPDRLVLFTDAVVAIAITLLILPLVDLAREPKPHAVDLITDNWTQILSFLLSFAVIARLWLIHHRMFQHVASYTPALVLVNMIWMFTVVVLPFPTEVISAASPDDRFPPLFYFCTILAGSVCQTILSLIIHRNPDIQVPDNKLKPRIVAAAAISTGMLMAGLVLMAAVPQVKYYALLSLLLSRPAVVLLGRFYPSVREKE